MPIYEFVCQNCGNEFELIRSFSDNSMPTCPHCANEQVDRQVGRPAIHFKGSGWYINDSKQASKSSAHGKDSSGEGSDSGSSAGKAAKDKPDKKADGAGGTKSADKGESTAKSVAKQ